MGRKKRKIIKEKTAVEVDVSGQLGDTKDTVFAFSNGEKFSIIISGKVKRIILDLYRESKSRSKDFPLHFYIAGLKILFRSCGKNISSVILDREVVGHEAKVKYIFETKFDSVEISSIGRKSPAHNLAHSVFQGKQPPNKRVKTEEIIVEMGLWPKK